MAATLRELRGRIRSAGSIKKITKAQELIATSRIAKAQARVEAARPYSAEITNMLSDLAAESALDHPLLVARENPKRAAVLVVSSDRGLCGAYNANVLRRAEELISLLREEGKAPVLYVVGRKALGYFTFRNWTITESWIGFSDKPTYEQSQEIADTLVAVHVDKFSDGRIFSLGNQLRNKHGFKNTLRAFGDVLRDQLFFLKRSGFNSYLIRQDRDPIDALKGLGDFSEPYQGALDIKDPAWKRIKRSS